jgi:hypothetical protein
MRFLIKHSNVYGIDHRAQWFVDPRFQQIGKINTNTSKLLSKIENTQKLIFDIHKFHGALTQISAYIKWFNFSNLHTPEYAHHVSILIFRK